MNHDNYKDTKAKTIAHLILKVEHSPKGNIRNWEWKKNVGKLFRGQAGLGSG